MILGIASLFKVWITVALSAGSLVAAVEVDSNSSPSKVSGERKPAIPATFSHSNEGNFLYQSGLVMGPDQPILNSDEEVYVDEGPSSKTEDAEEMKRSMGMLRLGRASSFDKRARSMAALRLGRSPPASAAEVEAGPATSNAWKRTMGMLRLGRRSDAAEDDEEEKEEEEKRSMGMLRLGRRSHQHHQYQQQQSEDSAAAAAAAAADKRSMGMLRLGRSGLQAMLSR